MDTDFFTFFEFFVKFAHLALYTWLYFIVKTRVVDFSCIHFGLLNPSLSLRGAI